MKIKHFNSKVRVLFTFSFLTVPKNKFNDSQGSTFFQTEALFTLPMYLPNLQGVLIPNIFKEHWIWLALPSLQRYIRHI